MNAIRVTWQSPRITTKLVYSLKSSASDALDALSLDIMSLTVILNTTFVKRKSQGERWGDVVVLDDVVGTMSETRLNLMGSRWGLK